MFFIRIQTVIFPVILLTCLFTGILDATFAKKGDEEGAWLDPNRQEPAGTKYKAFKSFAIGEEYSYLIYLPPGYETAKDKRYPVLYWLHGSDGSQRTGSEFISFLDAAIKKKQAPEMIAVLVNGRGEQFWNDSFDGERPVESVIIKDLIPHIDQTYRTFAKREGRAVEGFSMGGYGPPILASSTRKCSAWFPIWPERC